MHLSMYNIMPNDALITIHARSEKSLGTQCELGSSPWFAIPSHTGDQKPYVNYTFASNYSIFMTVCQ